MATFTFSQKDSDLMICMLTIIVEYHYPVDNLTVLVLEYMRKYKTQKEYTFALLNKTLSCSITRYSLDPLIRVHILFMVQVAISDSLKKRLIKSLPGDWQFDTDNRIVSFVANDGKTKLVRDGIDIYNRRNKAVNNAGYDFADNYQFDRREVEQNQFLDDVQIESMELELYEQDSNFSNNEKLWREVEARIAINMGPRKEEKSVDPKLEPESEDELANPVEKEAAPTKNTIQLLWLFRDYVRTLDRDFFNVLIKQIEIETRKTRPDDGLRIKDVVQVFNNFFFCIRRNTQYVRIDDNVNYENVSIPTLKFTTGLLVMLNALDIDEMSKLENEIKSFSKEHQGMHYVVGNEDSDWHLRAFFGGLKYATIDF